MFKPKQYHLVKTLKCGVRFYHRTPWLWASPDQWSVWTSDPDCSEIVTFPTLKAALAKRILLQRDWTERVHKISIVRASQPATGEGAGRV